MDMILPGITLASQVRGQPGREQRREVREALRRFRESARGSTRGECAEVAGSLSDIWVGLL